MKYAPEQIHFAYTRLVEIVFINIRNNTIKNKEQLRDLAAALHNIGGILTAYGTWVDDAKFRQLYLQPYDKKWGQNGLNLEKSIAGLIDGYTRR